ncbi:MAG: hypothetical protein AMXMBFR33_65510 [Candidatus Xenobia bacterium]
MASNEKTARVVASPRESGEGGTAIMDDEPALDNNDRMKRTASAAVRELESGRPLARRGMRDIDPGVVYAEATSPALTARKLLKNVVEFLGRAIRAEDDDLAQLTELEYALRDIHEAGTIDTGHTFWDTLVTGIEVALRQHRGIPFSQRELIALEKVCGELAITARPSEATFVKWIQTLEEAGIDFGGNFFAEAF